VTGTLRTAWAFVLASVALDTVGLMLLKLRMRELGLSPALLLSPSAVAGLAMFLAAPFAFAVAVSRMAITTAYPVQVGLNFALVALLSAAWLGEPLHGARVAGLVCVAMGAIVIGRSGRS
jgi:multidrug transporter EmrE-like cation transporter